MQLILYMWLGIQKNLFYSFYSYGFGQVHLGMPKAIPNIACAIWQD